MATVPPPTRPSVFNLPNQLTAARLVLAVVLFVFIAYSSWLSCMLVFAVAVVTDGLDGYLARKQGLTSTLGRNLDPLVDKVLIGGAYIFLLPQGYAEGWLQPWMVTLIVARELIITSLRSFLENQGVSFGADWLGKIKMVLQCAALCSIFIALYAVTLEASGQWLQLVTLARSCLIWAMLVATALSGLQYLWRAASLLKIDF
ncbi:MAG TPA: CDP-diacylglycerol--glycerol-3-phosphate 3-phosphatidyltransferase [Steroidobacteraceae bacterium]|jgi:CDP-diacylglycerol--glycerol-3-phosphate 3-phosphatidyltransferase|nr:CDP-diacylglycerol--glycerol-3-phosphate 3-phosphatidyltransferase [Gemmataceae bacterium]HWW22126.1 CDP-diacylglycerol--glycerol-3-phosphate 3-phosphatidyltransferase [Steroidobacteraceae bacterium]